MYGILIGIGIFVGASNWNPQTSPIPPTAALSADGTVQLTAAGTIELITP
jgi:hypothetical protein